MSESKKLSSDLLIVTVPGALPAQTRTNMGELLEKNFGLKALILSDGTTAEVHRDLSALTEAINNQTAAIGQLVVVNQQLLEAMLSEEEESEVSGGGYLNG